MSGSAQKAQRLIKPGYHLKPKYDLHGLRRRRADEHKGHIVGELPLTSMIDMFSILVIYLLMNFSATGEIFFVNKNLTLPRAMRTNSLQTGPLLSRVEDHFELETPPEFGEIPPLRDDSPSLSQVTAALVQLKSIATGKNIHDSNRINLQADENTPIGEIKRAMAAAVEGGWTNVNFVVEKNK